MTSIYTNLLTNSNTPPSPLKADLRDTTPPPKRAETRVKVLSANDSQLPLHLLFPGSPSSGEATPPSTPPAKSRISIPKTPNAKRNRELDPIYTTYSSVIQKLIIGIFRYNDKFFSVKKLEDGEGDYKQCFLIKRDQEQLIPPLINKNILIKAFKEEVVDRYREIPEYVENTISQYREAKRLKIECADIFNIDKKQQLIGNVIIQEKIAEPLDLTLWEGDKEINPELIPELVSIKRVFEIAVKECIDFDLLPQNFRHRGDRQIVLVDFREMESGPVEFQGHLKQALTAWAAGNPRVWDYLTSNLDVSERLKDELERLGATLVSKESFPLWLLV